MKDHRIAPLAFALAATTVLVYAGVLGHGFVEYDDDLYVTARPEVLAGLTPEGWHWAWTSFQGANWFPLTRLSWMLDAELFGAGAAGFHATSVAWHVLAVVLLFLALARLVREPWPAAFAAGVFALHPLHVESVAWVAARKDVVSGACFALALLFAERRARGGRPRLAAAALFLAMAAGLLAKPMLVTLPCVLLLLDYWPLGRLGSDGRIEPRRLRDAVVEKAPLFALALATSLVTLAAQDAGGALQSLERYPLGVRVAAALDALLRYLGNAVWPSGLAVFYPHPGDGVPAWRVAAGAAVLLGVSLACWRLRRRVPAALVGWAWFVGMLVPVSGLVQVGQAALADRYTYLPLIGPALALGWAGREIAASQPRLRGAVAAFGVASLAALALASVAQLHSWRDGEALFRHALAVTRDNHVAHTNLGLVLARTERGEEALGHLDRAIALAPGSAIAWGLRGELRVVDDPEAAASDLRTAARLEPRSARWRIGLGRALADSDPRAAEASLRTALAIAPEDASAHAYLGALLHRGGDVGAAAEHYASALADEPALTASLGAGGVARLQAQHAQLLQAAGRIRLAIEAYEAALAGGEQSLVVLNDLAWLLASAEPPLRDAPRALLLAGRATELSGGEPRVLDTLALAQAAAGRRAAAIATARRALAGARERGDAELASGLLERFPELASVP